MPRFYVEKDGEWNIFSTITDDFVFDEFVCLDALKARLLYERYKELTEDIDSLLTDKPSVNVMDYEEAMKRRKEQTMKKYIDTEWLKQNFNTVFWSQITKTIDSAPSIDIVRCQDCKWFDSGKNDSEIWSMCTRHFGKYIDVNVGDFCSYGERENDE